MTAVADFFVWASYALGPAAPLVLVALLGLPSKRVILGGVPAGRLRRALHVVSIALGSAGAFAYLAGIRMHQREDRRWVWTAAALLTVFVVRWTLGEVLVRAALRRAVAKYGSASVAQVGRVAGGLALRRAKVIGQPFRALRWLRALHAVRGLPKAGGGDTDAALVERLRDARATLRQSAGADGADLAPYADWMVEECRTFLRWRVACATSPSAQSGIVEAAREAVWDSLADVARAERVVAMSSAEGDVSPAFVSRLLTSVSATADVGDERDSADAALLRKAASETETFERLYPEWRRLRDQSASDSSGPSALLRFCDFAVLWRAISEGRLEAAQDMMRLIATATADSDLPDGSDDSHRWAELLFYEAAVEAAAEPRRAEASGVVATYTERRDTLIAYFELAAAAEDKA